jgi:hypothetical protein
MHRGTVPVTPRGGQLWGIELLKKMLSIYYDEAKKAKPDSLVISHIFNPYFDEVTDMCRLQDIYTDRRSIVDQMRHRARLARASCPECPIHTDQHPMPCLATWREYMRFQPEIGNPALYYVTGIETTYELITDDDWAMLREVWREYEKKLDREYGPRQ